MAHLNICSCLLSSSVNCKKDIIRRVPNKNPPMLKNTKGIGAFPTVPGSALKKFKIPNGFFPISVIEQTNKVYEINWIKNPTRKLKFIKKSQNGSNCGPRPSGASPGRTT